MTVTSSSSIHGYLGAEPCICVRRLHNQRLLICCHLLCCVRLEQIVEHRFNSVVITVDNHVSTSLIEIRRTGKTCVVINPDMFYRYADCSMLY